jgi:hypothetical protein
MLHRSGDANSFIGDDIDIFIGRVSEAMARIGAQIHFMVSISDVEGLGQFSRSGAKSAFIINFAPLFHQLDSAKRFHRPNQDKAVGLAFHEHVQHPVRSVTKIDIGGAGFVSFDERACGRTRKSVAGFVVLRQVGFGFDNFSGAFVPDQLSSYQFTGTSNRIAPEESGPNDSASHIETASPGRSIETKRR